MSANKYEFVGTPLRTTLIRLLVRGITVGGMVLYPLSSLVIDSGASQREALNMAGASLTGFAIYSHLSKSRFDPEEVFVPPLQIMNGIEFLLIGAICFVVALFS